VRNETTKVHLNIFFELALPYYLNTEFALGLHPSSQRQHQP